MRTQRKFRPSLDLALEDRVALSTFGAIPTAAGAGRLGGAFNMGGFSTTHAFGFGGSAPRAAFGISLTGTFPSAGLNTGLGGGFGPTLSGLGSNLGGPFNMGSGSPLAGLGSTNGLGFSPTTSLGLNTGMFGTNTGTFGASTFNAGLFGNSSFLTNLRNTVNAGFGSAFGTNLGNTLNTGFGSTTLAGMGSTNGTGLSFGNPGIFGAGFGARLMNNGFGTNTFGTNAFGTNVLGTNAPNSFGSGNIATATTLFGTFRLLPGESTTLIP